MPIYLGIQAALLVAAELLPERTGGAIRAAIVTGGTLILTIAVAVRRPEPRTAWWFVVVGALLDAAAGLALEYAYGLNRSVAVSAALPIVLAGLVLPTYAVGLILLSRTSPYGGTTDVLDAVMTAGAGFLLLWTFLVEPALATPGFSQPGAVLFSVGVLIVFAITVKLVFGGALRDRAVLVLLLAMVLLLVTSVVTLLPALSSASLRTSGIAGILWSLYGIALGAVGLHPALVRPRQREGQRTGALSGSRVLLYAVLALVAPAAWAVELTEAGRRLSDHTFAFTVPIVTSALFLLLLVVRLGLIARVAQARAAELAGRSTDLSRAVSEQDELQQQLAYRATHDPLTGLSNRAVLSDRLEELLSRPDGQARHALMLFDLDGFKDVNDTLGHPVGDELLVGVARRLRDTVPPGATLARLGGDEFVVLLENTEPETARQWAHDLLTAVGRTYSIGGRDLFVTTSVGVLNMDPAQPTPSPSDVLRDADLALYAAKEAGKNRIAVFQPELRAARLQHTRLNAGLRRALTEQEFVLHYQPVFDLDTGRIISVEALLRWRPADGGLISPAEFIPAAESSGIILPIGAWVLRAACQDARRWYDQYQISVSVNVSGRQLDDPTFADTVIAALTNSGLPGSALVIEITESTLVTSSRTPTLDEHLRRLRAFGVRAAIDDFGTGYSSLSYVAELPIDIVKIDKSFTQAPSGPHFAPQEWAFIRAILKLVDSLHLLAVAEGVETAAQADALRILHCPMVQGFHFGRPVPAEAIDRTLAASGPALARVARHDRHARSGSS